MAAWMPATEREDEWIGEASDDAKSRVGDEATRLAGKAREAAADAADHVRQRSGPLHDGNGKETRPDAGRL